jgi:UDP-glucose 4-epimerase
MSAALADPRFAAFAGARALVTGGLGFIGSTLARRLVALGGEVVVLDSLDPNYGGNRFNLAGVEDRVRVELGDVRDDATLRRLLPGCRFVFHLAAQTGHLDSMREPLVDLDINARASALLLEACRTLAPEAAIVYASTRQIYGRPERLPVDETHPLRPVDVNGINKIAGEAYHLLYAQVHGLRAASLRLTNTYGPRMRIKDNRQTFVGIWLRRVLEGEAFEVWEGTQRRDFTYVDDAAEAFLLAAITAEASSRAFNIGGHGPVSLTSLAETLVAANGGGRFERRDFPPERKRIDIGDYWADDALFRRVAGWQPQVDLAEGLRRSLAYYRANINHYL